MAGDSVAVDTSACANLATDILHGSLDRSLASRLTVQRKRNTETALTAFLLNVRVLTRSSSGTYQALSACFL